MVRTLPEVSRLNNSTGLHIDCRFGITHKVGINKSNTCNRDNDRCRIEIFGQYKGIAKFIRIITERHGRITNDYGERVIHISHINNRHANSTCQGVRFLYFDKLVGKGICTKEVLIRDIGEPTRFFVEFQHTMRCSRNKHRNKVIVVRVIVIKHDSGRKRRLHEFGFFLSRV